VRELDTVALIRAKRDGGTHTPAQLAELITQYALGAVPDYQMSAWLMAVCWRGLDAAETLALTEAMVATGVTLAPGEALGRRIVDKHSTGGVGDKTSLVLAPIVAACGVPVVKMSGRGLGHTGGTLDKLEAIPGMSIDLSLDDLMRCAREVGCAIAGQTADLVPADKLLYALRDVTGTVESVPLIAASIMSKKLAGGADAIVLDVKVGSGAFMRTIEEARVLADAMISIGRGAGRDVCALLTQMDRPLGRAIGNALEIREVVDVLRGEGPADLIELVHAAGAELLAMSDLGIDVDEARTRVEHAIASGAALERWHAWVRAQGGDPEAALPQAPVVHPVRAAASGWIERMDAWTLGNAAVHLGAGRLVKNAPVDHAVGIVLERVVGDRVTTGDTVALVHARDAAATAAVEQDVLAAIEIVDSPVAPAPVVLERRA
jgi:pyrimidine-nucleoside phosphorylase